jgi:hypothetical protein
MENTNTNHNSHKYMLLDKLQIQNIRSNYKVIDVYWLDHIQVNTKIVTDEYFKKHPKKIEKLNNMLDFYLNHNDKDIYKITDYLCHEKEKICICNVHAEDLTKIYDTKNYKNYKNKKFITWYNFLL